MLNLLLFTLVRCQCGRYFDDHHERVKDYFIDDGYLIKEKWDHKNLSFDCTADDGPTDSYGDVIFLGRKEEASKVILFYF